MFILSHQNIPFKDWSSDQIEALYHRLARFYQFQIKSLQINRFDMIEDLIQDVFLRILEKETQLKEKKFFSTWCFRIAVRELYLHQKRKRKDQRIAYQYQSLLIQQMESQIEILEQMIFDQKLAVLYRCIDKLPNQNRLLVLELLNNGKIEYLSEKWGLSIACLKSRYHTARKQIQSIMTAIDSFSHFLAS